VEDQVAHPVKGVDHVMVLVSDLDAMSRRYSALGFTLSPRGTHSPHMGSANYTIIFPDDYLELLGIVAETPHNADKRQILAERGDGIAAIACRIEDARLARASLAELGISASEAIEFSRPLPLPDGSSGVAAFAVTQFAPGEAPRGDMFMCQHKTRDMVWRPELMAHANGAQAIAAIVVASPTPEPTAHGFARLFAGGKVSPTAEGFSVATGEASAKILCMTPEALAARYGWADADLARRAEFAALQIAVADLKATRAHLQSAGVAFKDSEASLFVSPGEAGGVILEFVER
jgi:catechol 2,3-dioxygenase-like lactoylglutathione lyase family enzyme